MVYPIHRSRRLRRTEGLRALVRETRLTPSQFVMPLFVCPGSKVRNPISSMPGNFQLSVDELVEDCKKLMDNGIEHVILFGIPESKDPVGSSGYADDGIIPTAIRALKKDIKDLTVWGDVCMCEYTDHGHCGVIKDGDVDNDETLPLLAKAAVAYARAGADVIAPSDMMDGRVGAIRDALDEHGFENAVIVSYAAKYASAFYGPFREAAESPPQFGDRRSYQMDPSNVLEALSEVELDLEEGADIVMVKPALPYLDVIRRVKEDFDVPVAAYNVSGEFSMLHAAAENGWLDLERVMMESLIGIHRAGADIILTYFAPHAARLLR
ncbi:MAG: porphobilinogen synthase [Proteobacteria bacterium]|nr:porphobilinogen synthase [Pseudomonadota bacterium]